jgi:hypothetical protein
MIAGNFFFKLGIGFDWICVPEHNDYVFGTGLETCAAGAGDCREPMD